jgi:hypothetical protein
MITLDSVASLTTSVVTLPSTAEIPGARDVRDNLKVMVDGFSQNEREMFLSLVFWPGRTIG